MDFFGGCLRKYSSRNTAVFRLSQTSQPQLTSCSINRPGVSRSERETTVVLTTPSQSLNFTATLTKSPPTTVLFSRNRNQPQILTICPCGNSRKTPVERTVYLPVGRFRRRDFFFLVMTVALLRFLLGLGDSWPVCPTVAGLAFLTLTLGISFLSNFTLLFTFVPIQKMAPIAEPIDWKFDRRWIRPDQRPRRRPRGAAFNLRHDALLPERGRSSARARPRRILPK